MKKKKSKAWIVWLIVLAVVIGLGVWGFFALRNFGQQLSEIVYETHTVARGTVARSITGSGRLDPADTEDLEAESGIEIASVAVQQGDAVHAGDTLLTYQSDSIRDRIDALYAELSNLDLSIMRRTSKETVTAPTSGRVKAIYAEVGDELDTVMREHGALLLLSSDEKMQLTIASAEPLAIGKAVTVRYAGGQQNGTVANVVADGYLVTLPDNNVPVGELAEVFDRDAKLGEGVLSIHAPVSVYGVGGTVAQVNVSVNATVFPGAKLFTLADKPDSASFADALQQREDKMQEITALYALLDNPVLTAPADGTVALVNAKEGSTSVGTAIVLHTGGATKMTVNVDELDIGVLSLGQEAAITLDAFAGESFAASVTHISRIGTPAGSITTYAVELTLAPDERLLEGMNGSAVITAQKKDDVLLIPVKAIHEDETGVYVLVKVGEETLRRDITTGLADGTNAEVTSGLNEGDAVLYQNDYIGIAERYQQMGMGMRGGND